MEFKKKELITIWNTLEGLKGTQYSRKFSYGIVRNKKILRDEVESLQEAQTPADEYIAYEKERIALCEEYADKDETGKAVQVKGQYYFSEENPKFKELMKALVDKNKQVLEDAVKKEKEFLDILEETVDLPIYKMALDVFPESIDIAVLEVLEVFIKEEDETIIGG